jgi:hypothetical protein
MSFRFEEKFLIDIKNKNNLMNYLNNFSCKQLHPERKISSIYFDNFKKEMFSHSEEGLVPRKKLRIRNYPSQTNSKIFFETKINSVEGKYKISKIIKDVDYINFLKKGIFDKSYGTCEPQIEVNYNREYYQLKNIRVTIDTDIKYKKFNSNISFNNNNILICEFKSNDIKNIRNFYDSEIFTRVRISKYCDAVEKLSC